MAPWLAEFPEIEQLRQALVARLLTAMDDKAGRERSYIARVSARWRNQCAAQVAALSPRQ